MTTNAGSGGTSGILGFGENAASRENDRTVKALGEFLKPEFLNRVDEIITFRSLTMDDFRKIAVLQLTDSASVLADKRIRLTWTDEAAAFVAEKSYSVKFGARNMRRYIQTEIEDKIASEIIHAQGKVSAVHVDVDDHSLVVRVI